jgi:lipid A oxidase
MHATLRSGLQLVALGNASIGAGLDKLASLAAAGILCAMAASAALSQATAPDDEISHVAGGASAASPGQTTSRGRETLLAGYVAQPFYGRSDVHMTRSDGTNLTLKGLGWDGDALRFPIDGGVRAVTGAHTFAFMVDFLHNKAVSRLGKGAHGRKLANPVIEDADTVGMLKGAPAPGRVKLTEVFERLEFTHGHNVLLFTPLVRLASIAPRIRPYVGIGAGFALPHVEVWFPGESKEVRTNEYQFAGPAAQVLAGLEIRTGKMSYFVEYKFTYAWISAALTGDQSWINSDMPGDLLRQVRRWWSGEEPKIGRLSTTLAAHQVAVGAGYWLSRSAAAP